MYLLLCIKENIVYIKGVDKALGTAKRKFGDRKDAAWIKNIDSMHVLFPYLMPNRSDNEALLTETIDLTEINKYLEKKNKDNPAFKYTFFHIMCAAMMKMFVLRPKLNRFYSGKRLYQRNDFTISFVVKKQFADSSEEGLAIVKIDPLSDVSPVEQIHSQVEKYCTTLRKEGKNDGATDMMNILRYAPRPVLSIFFAFLRLLEFFGLYPDFLMKEDPYYTSLFVSNLGSIKMDANYHHLANWGTNSVFAIIGEKKPTPFFNADGSYVMKDALNLSVTLDERIADGYYYARSIQLMKKLVANPELLDRPVSEPVDF